MQKKLEDALTELLIEYQDADTVRETVSRLVGVEVRIIHGVLNIWDEELDGWHPVFKVRVSLDPL